MSYIFVLDTHYQPLAPCSEKRGRELLDKGKAAVYKCYPFTIILKRAVSNPAVPPCRLKIDPGSQTTGLAILQENRVIWAADLVHRGRAIKQSLDDRRALRRNRRSRKTRYRKPRFLNRTRAKGWLPPSLESRISNVLTWVDRLQKVCNIAAISQEVVRFDTQKLQNPEVSGVEYQQGELFGYEVREYLLTKWGRKCAYCDVENTPLEVEHIVPKSKGGSDSPTETLRERVSNLTLACHKCNQEKGNQDIRDFLSGKPSVLARVLKQAKAPLKDAAAVNATRWKLYQRLTETGLPIEVGTGGTTKYNRTRLELLKTHWLDAACVGQSTPENLVVKVSKPLSIKATGRGNRQRVLPNKYGFARGHRPRQKQFFGFQTGDIVKATVTNGKYAGIHTGRVAVRSRPSFRLNAFDVHPKYLQTLQRADGYEYAT